LVLAAPGYMAERNLTKFGLVRLWTVTSHLRLKSVGLTTIVIAAVASFCVVIVRLMLFYELLSVNSLVQFISVVLYTHVLL